MQMKTEGGQGMERMVKILEMWKSDPWRAVVVASS